MPTVATCEDSMSPKNGTGQLHFRILVLDKARLSSLSTHVTIDEYIGLLNLRCPARDVEIVYRTVHRSSEALDIGFVTLLGQSKNLEQANQVSPIWFDRRIGRRYVVTSTYRCLQVDEVA